MSEFLDTKKRIKTLHRKVLDYGEYSSLNRDRIRECKVEISKLDADLKEMQKHRCLVCFGSGKKRKWFFFWRQCNQCCGDGYLIHVTASRINDTCC